MTLRRHGNVSNLDLYNAIERLETRVNKLESRVSYVFGGFAVASLAVAVFEILVHHVQV